jgi:DNA-binding GntR family transcriptional regulator
LLVDELEATGETYLNAEQMQRFVAADRGFHTLLMAFSFNPRIRKIVDETRLLIRIFAMRRIGYDTKKLRTIHTQHAAIIAAIVSGDAGLAMNRLVEHIQISLQERLDEFDRNRRASTIAQSYSDLISATDNKGWNASAAPRMARSRREANSVSKPMTR